MIYTFSVASNLQIKGYSYRTNVERLTAAKLSQVLQAEEEHRSPERSNHRTSERNKAQQTLEHASLSIKHFVVASATDKFLVWCAIYDDNRYQKVFKRKRGLLRRSDGKTRTLEQKPAHTVSFEGGDGQVLGRNI